MRVIGVAAVAVCVVLTAAGCREDGGDATPRPGASAAVPAGSGPGPRTDQTFKISRTVPATEAREALPRGPWQRVHYVAGQNGGRTTKPLAVTAAGELVVAMSPPAKTGNETVAIGQSRVGLWNGSGFHPFPLPAGYGGPPRQTAGGTERDGVAVWAETASTDLYRFDWRVYAYDAATGRTRLLGDSAAMAPKAWLPLGPGNGEPVIGDRTAYWSTTYPTEDEREFGMRVMKRPVTGEGTLDVAVDQAKFPAAAGSDLYYVRSHDVAPRFPEGRYEIRRLTPAGDDQAVAAGPLGAEQEVSKLVAEGERLAWVVSSPSDERSTLYLRDSADNEAVAFPLEHAAPWTMYVNLTSSLLTWSNGSASGDAGQYVYELSGQRLWRLGTVDGHSIVHGSGNAVAWSELSADNVSAYHTAIWKPTG
ncbi:hypothetical protein [Actinoplanes sp. NPDC049802]|uniref:hypothetical protein n=1 Tax=Actinoplanes sp. NPDC049802 TaxID=3154742 RepID=UPI0033ECCD6B